jgi:methionyl-tRNA formyltransferase
LTANFLSIEPLVVKRKKCQRNNPLRFAFLGTPTFGAIVLERLIAHGYVPSVVITNPDRPAGKKQILTAPPVKVVAEKNSIPVWQPEKLTPEAWREHVGEVDCAVVAAYGKIIPGNVLVLPARGFIGVHPSSLPQYRGASPIQSMILAGETNIGVSLFVVDAEVDHGPVYRIEPLTDVRAPEMDYRELHDALATLGGDALANILPDIITGTAVAKPQDHSQATFTKKFTTDDAQVDLEKDEREMIWRKLRAFDPEPGAWTIDSKTGKRMKLLDALWDGKTLTITKIQYAGGTPQKIENVCTERS